MGLLSVSDEAMIAFTAQVDQMNADVGDAAAQLPALDSPEASQNEKDFLLWQMTKWLPWYMDWLVWRGLHEDGLSRLAPSAALEFGKWQSEFNLHLQDFKQFGGATQLEPFDPGQPAPPPTEEEEEAEGDEPWYETVTDIVAKNMMVTTLLAGAGLLAYYHVTKPR